MRNTAWIFDLDNTLHNATPHIFPRINRAMTAYLQRELGLDELQASALRSHYWKRYGATLIGLMRHHGTDPHHFLHDTHQFPDLARVLLREPGLRAALRRLPGRKFVFSNSPDRYARMILGGLGVADLFEGVFAIEHARFRPKPDSYGFLRLCRARHLRPRRCIMVEDTLDNLRTAKRLGMRTVWVTRAAKAPGYVDACVSGVADLERLARYWK